jgi:hypothetical protein
MIHDLVFSHDAGVLEVACDLENQIVKVTGNADPDRLLKKVKKVKRKSKLISYTNPGEMPEPSFRSDIPPPPPPPPPPYAFHQPVYEERFRPPSHEPHVFARESHGPYGPPPGHVRPNLRPSMHYDSEPFYNRAVLQATTTGALHGALESLTTSHRCICIIKSLQRSGTMVLQFPFL